MNNWYENKELPPVGCECEWCGLQGDYWVKGVVVALSGTEIVFSHDGKSAHKPNSYEILKHKYIKFRPIKSPEDIEREKAIAEMITLSCSKWVEKNCAVIYDAGYRKQGKEVSIDLLSRLLYRSLHTEIKLDAVCKDWINANFTITRKGE